MFHEIATNVNDLYANLLYMVKRYGHEEETRNGKARALPGPLLVEVECPEHRVLFCPTRDANPFFHLMEAIWMIAGRNDVEFPARYTSGIAQYSDDGVVFNAAYGHRWRNHFGYDQVRDACEMLKASPHSRRVVLGMWDVNQDLAADSKDIPCNTQIMCRINAGCLDFTITNRSNDLIFGLCGANAVHMSVLQEFMAAWIGVDVGHWYHLTNNLHVYEKHYPLLDSGPEEVEYPDYMPLIESGDVLAFEYDCMDFCKGMERIFYSRFFGTVVGPMDLAWKAYKRGDITQALIYATQIESTDWRMACYDWLQRRAK